MSQLALFDEDARPEQEPVQLLATVRAEWYTPAHIVERTLAVLGAIDLDPCSTSLNVPAALRYTIEENGLTQRWGPNRRVFLNPPHSRATGVWVDKLCTEYEGGNLAEAIALVRAAVDTDWWLRLISYPVCFIHGRLRLSGEKDNTTFPSAVIYLGPNLARFADAFGDIGAIYVPYQKGLTAQDLQVIQLGRYILTIHQIACELTIANLDWQEASGSEDQERLRQGILKIPGIVPSRYNNVTRSREGTIRLVFHYDKEQADDVISEVRALLGGPRARPKSSARRGR